MDSNERVFFYLPTSKLNFLPKSIDEYWEWQSSLSPSDGLWGKYHWVLQTHLYLSDYGFNCELVDDIPDAGIIVSHRDCFDNNFRHAMNRYLVCLLVDRNTPHPYADFHVLHNPIESIRFTSKYCYLPPWPQISLIERNPIRKDAFETIGFYGYPENLDKKLKHPSFLQMISDLGMNFYIPEPKNWNDFSEVDLLIGVRKFGMVDILETKPALKIFNAWLAGIPIITGYESACRVEGQVGVDYVESTTYDQLSYSIRYLRDNFKFRNFIVGNGKCKVKCFSPLMISQRWMKMFQNIIIPNYKINQNQVWKVGLRNKIGRIKEGVNWRIKMTYATHHANL